MDETTVVVSLSSLETCTPIPVDYPFWMISGQTNGDGEEICQIKELTQVVLMFYL